MPMENGDRYRDIVLPEYYEDIFTEDDLEFRFRLIRKHIHPKLRALLVGCLDHVSDVLETDPHTFSRMKREPKSPDGGAERLRCALYRFCPNEVRGEGYPNLRNSSGRGRQVPDFDLSFFVDQEGLGLELHVGRHEELCLLEELYGDHRDSIDALLTLVRLGVDGPAAPRLLPLKGMIEASKAQRPSWIAIFEQRYPFPIVARDFMGRFEDCFLALYIIYDAMLSRALGIEDKFEEQFARLDTYFQQSAPVEGLEGGPGGFGSGGFSTPDGVDGPDEDPSL